MKNIYLTGHNNFGNRGCEAIVRGTLGLLKEAGGDIELLVPSSDIPLDRAQWPDAEEQGVHFVDAVWSVYNKYWRQVQRLPVRRLKQAGWPFPLSRVTKSNIDRADAVLSIGGDNYSLDYLLPSLLMGTDGYAMKRGKPVVLWGASVGPFEAEPDFVPLIREHLERMALITARESVTEKYLKESLRLSNVLRVADPAFYLAPQSIDTASFWPDERGAGAVGLNISPLLRRYRPRGEDPGVLLDEVASFVKWLVVESGMAVLLVPHVAPLTGGQKNNDAYYMQGLLDRTTELAAHVKIVPSGLNAAQTKFVISQCRFFVGARTHATIAALSSTVPTISIAYSVKSKGINRDLFGHTEHVLDSSDVSADSLRTHFCGISSAESSVRALLAERMPTWRGLALEGARAVKRLL